MTETLALTIAVWAVHALFYIIIMMILENDGKLSTVKTKADLLWNEPTKLYRKMRAYGLFTVVLPLLIALGYILYRSII